MVDFHPSEIRFFWSRGTGPISRQISRITAPGWGWLTGRTGDVPSHMGIVLSGGGSVVYGEAHAGSHWQYPLPIALLYAWRDQSEGRKLWFSDPLPIPVEAVPAIHARAERNVHLWRYSTGQIWRMWLWRRLRIPIPTTPCEVVCSEAAARLLVPWYDLAGQMGLRAPDYVTPGNSMRFVGSRPVNNK